MKLSIVGTGYVGLVTGACFAERGNQVTCVDNDPAKLAVLRGGGVPIYEPGLESMVARNVDNGSLGFTDDLAAAVQDAHVIMIAVGTPPGADGSADLSAVLAVARAIGAALTDYAVIVTKSTVPVGTADLVREAVAASLACNVEFDVVSNPEFLKEGAAVDDFMRPDRVVVGTDSERARDVMSELYEPFSHLREKLIFMGARESEMTKYAANAMLATKISFMNEIANLCERLGADVESVRRGIGSDSRIGYSFIYPGIGYGGSCFPKDVKALVRTAKSVGFDALVLNAVEARNDRQKHRLVERVVEHFGDDLSGKSFGLWGLSFKPGTDDMREAPALVIIQGLVAKGAKVKAYDPVAMTEATRDLQVLIDNGSVELTDHQYAAVEGVDSLILATEWSIFRQPDFEALMRLMGAPVIFDGRNQYNPERLRRSGFHYVGIGR
ncbi:UDP-glucose dehydrogenase family protein [Litorivicinus lipolyticus]|uniref:UDP-glucose dehydrogenase family protein n=1 Tax=Litorivicinus lipolyticus TaxID=418701 RepID=UPI003B598126